MSNLKFLAIPPYHYVHIMDTETNITSLEEGPKNLTLTIDKKQIGDVNKMLVIPSNQYFEILNPVARDVAGKIINTANGFIKRKIGLHEYRTREEYPQPFSLYPGEVLVDTPECLVVLKNEAIEIFVEEDWTDPKTEKNYIAGQSLMFQGPFVYVPKPELSFKQRLTATSMMIGEAI